MNGLYPDDEIKQKIDRITGQEKFMLLEKWQEYVVACQLSRGPLPDRSAHWTDVADQLGIRLREMLE